MGNSLKIGVFSPRINKNHIVFYETLSFLFNNQGINVVFFVDNWFENKLKISGNDKFIYNKFKSEFFFYFKHFYKLKKLDYIIIEPDSSKILLTFFTFFFNLKFSLVIHNANYWLFPLKKGGFRKSLIIFLNNILFKRAKSIIVVNSNVKEYCLENSSKNTFCFPFNLYIKSNTPPIINLGDSFINLVIPGNVSEKRRDYLTILRGFEIAMKYRRDLRLVLLGKVDKNEKLLYEKIQNLKVQFQYNIVFWDKFIEDKEFEFYIESASLFIAPLNQYISTDISIEEYGITKETGVTSFIRKNKKYCLAPDYLAFEADINHLIICYKDSMDFSNLLRNLCLNDLNEDSKNRNESYMKYVNNEVNLFLKDNF